ncbi:hypothetical protein CC1G_08418 [Coprinopsis cinerea okayama7|uniref:Uncharacterized protein n=1 Tax=Coprinopsis cinerea (strain Okayama-7 / 130 / ATCC MYA-4618 / FGSC 9003) TaxID=240176 RepID=A8NAP9_COPC7|nr:hypothetical protein CC1G_08418 [Coprinopsis cinerea okayama7\|eukprot:XP_001831901.1 hypothetical protein CC1G_08418 [Coprinopsis cinerea okayama7\
MSDNDIGNSLKTSYLLFKSLENMNGLTQLRIRIYYDVPEAEGSARQLNEILCDPGALREMHTLFMTCCWECMDIPAIIKARPKLQNLGLYGTMGTRCGVDALEKLRQEGVTHLPLTFELRIWAYTSALDQLAFAPWFHVDSDPKEILHRVRSLLGDHRRATHPETFIDINHAVLYWKDAGSGHLAGQYEEILKDYFPRAEILVQSIYDQTHNY